MSSLAATPGSAAVTSTATPSLLAYLWAEASQADKQAREALFITYNVSLEFFETRLLGVSRACGAAVTVVADAHQYAPNPRGIRGAGRSYVVGLAHTVGAFHPKVSVLAGAERAIIGIGSGNLTVNGWHRNDEILTVITADRSRGCPAVVTDVAAWLQSLPDHVTLSTLAADGIRRTALELAKLVAAAPPIETGHRFATTTGSPILRQLPPGEVDRLDLYAPFHDDRGAALGALLDRYRPRSVRLGVQPGETVIEPSVLRKTAEKRGVTLSLHRAGDAYRHGKLIQAVRTDGTGWTLTGSPNLTAAALLHSLENSGNCEAAIIASMSASLYPGQGPDLSPDDVPAVSIPAPGESSIDGQPVSAFPVLLGAILGGGEISLQFARPLPAGAVLEMSPYDDLPEHYHDLGALPAGCSTVRVSAPAGAQSGARIRVTVHTAQGPVWGPDIHLTDPVTVLRRIGPAGHGRANINADPATLFNNPQIAEAWQRALSALLTSRGTVALPRARNTGAERPSGDVHVSEAEGWRTVDSADDWARYIDDATVRLGAQMTDFALGGLPQLVSSSEQTATIQTTPIWFDRFTELSETDNDDEHTADELDDITADTHTPSSLSRTRSAEHERLRYRRWLHKLGTMLETAPAIDRSAMLGVILIGTHGDIWEETDGTPEWFDLLANAACDTPGPDVPKALATQLASLLAISLHLLDVAQPPGRSRQNQLYRTAVETTRDFLEPATIESVAANVAYDQDSALGIRSEAIWEHLQRLLAGDDGQIALRALERSFSAHEVQRVKPLVYAITGDFTNPAKIAAQALMVIDDLPTVAVQAHGRSKTSTLIRHQNVLTHVTELGARHVYKTYALSGLTDPESIVGNSEIEKRARIDPPPWLGISRTALSALEAVGLG